MQKINDKKLIIILIILILFILGLSGYIIYDKFKQKKDIELNDLKNTTTKHVEVDSVESLKSKNIYSKNDDYEDLKETTNILPSSKQDIINLIYTVLDHGLDSFTFECPTTYNDCIIDTGIISRDVLLLNNINNYVHPYNSFQKILIETNKNTVLIKVIKKYDESSIYFIEDKVNTIINEIINSEMSKEEQIKTIHDYIINNGKHDASDEESYNVKGLLFTGKGSSNAYSELFSIFVNKLDFNNFRISSDTLMWNAIYVNNEWKHIDLTFDDPIIVGNEEQNNLYYNYYLKTTEELLDNNDNKHNFDSDFYQEFK